MADASSAVDHVRNRRDCVCASHVYLLAFSS